MLHVKKVDPSNYGMISAASLKKGALTLLIFAISSPHFRNLRRPPTVPSQQTAATQPEKIVNKYGLKLCG